MGHNKFKLFKENNKNWFTCYFLIIMDQHEQQKTINQLSLSLIGKYLIKHMSL